MAQGPYDKQLQQQQETVYFFYRIFIEREKQRLVERKKGGKETGEKVSGIFFEDQESPIFVCGGAFLFLHIFPSEIPWFSLFPAKHGILLLSAPNTIRSDFLF
jgi:hypothetical protein